jgi:hypothetical protein
MLQIIHGGTSFWHSMLFKMLSSYWLALGRQHPTAVKALSKLALRHVYWQMAGLQVDVDEQCLEGERWGVSVSWKEGGRSIRITGVGLHPWKTWWCTMWQHERVLLLASHYGAASDVPAVCCCGLLLVGVCAHSPILSVAMMRIAQCASYCSGGCY